MSASQPAEEEAAEVASGSCCPLYHEAVELIGRRWTGAILRVLMDGSLRFSEIAQAIPELSDRLLSERMKELEARGIVERKVIPGPPLRVEYRLSQMGGELSRPCPSSGGGPGGGLSPPPPPTADSRSPDGSALGEGRRRRTK